MVDRNTYDVPIKTQIQLHAVVSGTLTELGLKQLLQKLYDEANATRGFKYHGGKPTHVFIYLYTSQDHFKSGMGQWIAMLSKIGEGARIDTEVKTELIAQLDAKPEVKLLPLSHTALFLSNGQIPIYPLIVHVQQAKTVNTANIDLISLKE